MSKARLIRLSPPQFDQREERAITAVLRSGNIAQGKRVREFERGFAQLVGVKHAVAVNNGTTALVAAIMALDIGENDEVITTPFTFGATANCVMAVGAKVIFADIDPNTYCLNPILLEKSITKRTKAIIAVDLFGQCANWPAIVKIARRHKLFTIEDAAQAHGASLNNQMAGSFATLGTFSFYATKNMTTGEGGMITTNDNQLYQKLLLLRNHGAPSKYHYEMLGYNFRLTDLQAALGLEQLKKLIRFNNKRQLNARYLSQKLASISGIVIPTIKHQNLHVFHQFVIRVVQPFPLTRDELAERLTRAGIETAIHYPIPLHLFPLYQKSKTQPALSVAEKYCAQVLSLPVHPGLSSSDLKYIVDVVSRYSQ